MSKPVLFLVPGFWEGNASFEPLATRLNWLGYETRIAPRPSTDLPASENPEPSMEKDVAAIHQSLLPLVESGNEVIMVLHSAGGYLGGEAMKGLDIKSRQQENLKGGVISFMLLTAASIPAGTVHGELPFACADEAGYLHCKQPEHVLFNDFREEQLKEWISRVKPQPKGSWTGTTNYVGWTVLPSHYIVFEKDQCLPSPLQLQLAESARSKVIRGFQAGHMGHLSQTEELAKIIDKTISEQ